MSFLKRIGTQAVKFEYEIELKRVDLKLNFDCNFKIIWIRGNNYQYKLITQNLIKYK